MVHALTVALQEFEGALIIVSHDRHLLANTVDEFYSIHQGQFSEFKGSLSDYESWLRSNDSDNEEGGQSAEKANEENPKLDKKRQRQLAAAKREELAPLRKEVKQLEKQMEKNQAGLDRIEEKLADQSLYEDSAKARLTELLQEQGQLKSALAEAEERWLELQERLTEA
jgi:ATP-binding cassette subfamily F protein 3